jgi:hypothetical protein
MLDDCFGCRRWCDPRDQRAPPGWFGLNLIEENAKTFAVDAVEREHRPFGRPKNELGDRAFGQCLLKRGVH